MILGTQSVMAQSTIEINAEAAEKTEALRKYIKFDNVQRDNIYIALKTYGERNARLDNETTNPKAVAKIEKKLDDKIRTILTEEQYDRYKTFLEE
tara:strand:+ start:8124 stop:8408 length:285 start_codon:yes stop_codon:yes gene_type:complete